jgi:cation diffusion facilitator CzcD-associated flavoprotein CzcO
VTNADPSASIPRHKHRDTDLEARRSPDVDVLIVGSGFSGIGMGVRLRQVGIESFLIIEKAEDLGGNCYPGCACDIPSHPYSLSFVPRSDWRRSYPSQPELDHLARQIGCKRTLVSNDYYPSLTRPNVELVTEGIAEVVTHAILTRDGIKRPIDVLIFGTGF